MTRPAITLYMTGWCPYCQRAGALLAGKPVDVTRVDVDEDPTLRQQMIERSGRRSVPQIFFGDHHLGGCDDLIALDASGELDRLIQGDQ